MYPLPEPHHSVQKPLCQCYQLRVTLADTHGTSDFLGNNHTPEVVNSSDNTRCFHFIFLRFNFYSINFVALIVFHGDFGLYISLLKLFLTFYGNFPKNMQSSLTCSKATPPSVLLCTDGGCKCHYLKISLGRRKLLFAVRKDFLYLFGIFYLCKRAYKRHNDKSHYHCYGSRVNGRSHVEL